MRTKIGAVAVVAVTLVLTGCSQHGCKLGGFPADITNVFFDLRDLSLPADPNLSFTMCSKGRCENHPRSADPPYISFTAAAAAEKLDSVNLTIDGPTGTPLLRSATADGPFSPDDYFPNGADDCPPRQYQVWLRVKQDGTLELEPSQRPPLQR